MAGHMTPAPRVLAADDHPHILSALKLLLRSEGFELETVTSPAAAHRAVEAGSFDVVLIDLNYARDTTSGSEGLELLERLHSHDEMLPVVVMTAWGSVDLAVTAMRLGARSVASSFSFSQGFWTKSRRWSSDVRCAAASDWRRRIGCSAAMTSSAAR